ncbi:putative ribonuclease H-like domain-containing protein [Tanacetum coccineum]
MVYTIAPQSLVYASLSLLVYVDDIIFGSTKRSWCDEFEALMKSRFQMSSIGELTFFLGLQVKQKENGIFISQDKYVVEILKKFNFTCVKTASTPIETQKPLTKDEEADDVDIHLYRSMIGSLMYLTASRPDIMFDVLCFCLGFQKQTIMATSTIEAEYVAAANCCGQVLWIQNQMLDYGFNFMNTKIYIDNESTICIVKNPVFHSKTKHIEIRHHFIRDAYEKKLIQVLKIHTNDNVGDLLTKAFDVSRMVLLLGLGKKMLFGLVLRDKNGDHTSKKAEGGMNLEELFVLCTNLSNRVLALETSKDAQAAEILKLKDQIKKLKRKCKPSISHHRAWLKSVKKLSMKKRLGRKEYVSKQGRKNAKHEPTLDAFDDLDADGRDYMETKDVVKEGRQSNETEELNKGSSEKGGSTKELVSTAMPKIVSTDRPELSTARPDVDAARQLQVGLQAEVERERQREEEASKGAIAETYDEVQAGIDADALFVAKLQQEEREEYTIEERAKFLAETIAAQRKFRAA